MGLCLPRGRERPLHGVRAGIGVVSIEPYHGYRQAIRAAAAARPRVWDHFHLVRGANTALEAVRRKRQRQSRARRSKGVRRSGQHAAGRPRALPRPAPPAPGPRTLPDRDRRRLVELFEREPLIAEAWAPEGKLPPRLPGRSPHRSRSAPRDDPRRGRPCRPARLRRVRQRHPDLAPGTARVPRRTDHQRPTPRASQQGQGNQAPRLRHPHLTAFRHRVLPRRQQFAASSAATSSTASVARQGSTSTGPFDVTTDW